MQTVPGGGFYLIKVTGSVTHTWNPECGKDDTPVRQCDRSLDGATLGPLDNIGGAYITLGGGPVGVSMENGREPWREYLRPHNGAAAVFVRYDGPVTLWARRTIVVGCDWTIWSSCGDGYVPQYFLSGGNEVQVLYVPVPASVEGPTVVAPGQSITFTGRTVQDYPVDEPYAGYRSIWWTYLEGDTLTQPGKQGTEAGAWNCSYKLSCAFAPRVSGRMRMIAYINGYEVTAYSEILHVQESSMNLSCTGDLGSNKVTRGSVVHCQVSATPSGALTDIRWSFADSAGHAVTGPPDVPVWGGTMAVGGTISVTALLDSLPVHADTVISVQARTWPSMSVVAVDSGNGHLPTHPTLPRQLADTHPPIPSAPIAIDTIASGPNEGFAYLPTAVASVTTVVHISAGFNPGTPLYNLQHSGVDPLTHDPFCTKRQFNTVIQRGARQHEGLIPGPTPSHVSVYRQWFSHNRPQDSLEPVNGYLRDFSVDYPFDAYVEAEFDQHVSSAAASDPNQHHPNETPPGPVAFPTVPCRPRLF
jgi:hypothetical protein